MPAKLEWQPILKGVLAARAIDAVLQIAAELEALPPYTGPVAANVAAETALLYAKMGDAGLGSRFFDRSVEMLERAADLLEDAEPHECLLSGFTGVAWLTTHLLGDGGSLTDRRGKEAPSAQLDQELLDRLSGRTGWRPRFFDLVEGLWGSVCMPWSDFLAPGLTRRS